MGKPTYLTSLRPEDNLRLGEKYDEVNEEDRWQRFESVVDPELVKHIDRATRYFKRHPQAVVPRTQEGGFFDSVRKALTRLDRRQLSRVDLKVLDSMFETMERWNPAEGCQSRERLHEAIYNGNTPPRVWRGEVQQPSYEIDHASDREGWRYLIDALSNEHHAQMHGWEVLAQLVGVSPQP